MSELFSTRVSPDEKVIIGNEGSSRSSKTWDTFHFIVAFCDANRGNPQDIYIIRDSLVNCRDYTLKEFQDCLTVIGIYDSRCMVNSPKPTYTLWGHKIKFRGLDDEGTSEGYPSDILFFNEVLEHNQSGVMGLIMRCRKMVIMDWNPKYTDHWVFNMEKRPDTVFTRTTYKNNRHLQKSVIKEIESYNPDIPENVVNGTADAYRWKVYGLGERCNREGLVFPVVTWIDYFPTDLEQISYGIDFGETAQTAIVKTGIRISGAKKDLYLQKLFYEPTADSTTVFNILEALKLKEFDWLKECKKDVTLDDAIPHIWCDNNQPGWINDLRSRSVRALVTKKFPGSREYWISTIRKFNIHIVKDPDFRKEQENFAFRVVDGITLSETIKKYDHLWSASGYSVVGDFRLDG